MPPGNEVCNEKHKRVDEQLKHHEAWLGEHENKIDRLDRSDAANTASINNLCTKISDLVTTLKWLIGFVVAPLAGGLIGLFFYALQKGMFR
ncbi:hemolysin XhlA family protein [Pseudobacteroides cellulosolvens]|uniref:Hemolysin XhlA n=1 Tax=Pseudobacteroides cellulosolvens ATCC 35603 = DSM 2933 TaxID=398512 RepID=A0A0L6JHA3_9FIRM|nr:hemolysin XhlA family protein [Pseudobacteroides cellulosolvens]KNY24852.1 Hemolysin XhlA [Pseudobacteroides cellulosolvens ATCC 35603 = DSM 2933]